MAGKDAADMATADTQVDGYLPRVCDELIAHALKAPGAVEIVGPKWCGKTTSARHQAREARYFQDPDQREAYRQLAEQQPSLLLRGEKPLLLDEWQDVPQVWDAVRFAVDQDGTPGQFLLTGSTAGTKNAQKEVRHSGTGRIARLRMRPMSLFESGESSGEVSLQGVMEGNDQAGAVSTLSLEGMTEALVRGGWPASVVHGEGAQRALDYVESVIERDASAVDGVERNPTRVRLLMRSLARNESSEAAMTTLEKDMAVDEKRISVNTISGYLTALRALFILEDQEAWASSARSKVAIRTSPVRRYCDPSLPAALLRLTPDKLLEDMNTLGLFFESLVVRDLRVYTEASDAMVYRYRDARGLECDAVIERGDGRWGAVEVKLSDRQVDAAIANLLTIQQEVRSQHGGKASFLMVITNGPIAYQHASGVQIVPLGCLGV